MKKLIGIFIVTLLIGTAIPTLGTIIETHPINENELDSCYNYEYVPGELIVKFKKPPILSLSINNLNEKYKVSSIEKLFVNSESSVLDNIYILKFSEDSNMLSIVNDYSKDPNVIYAELNGLAQIANGIPNDANFSDQWHLHNTGQTGGTEDCDIDAPEIWDITTGSSDIVIAVIDSGIDYTHPDLIDNLWTNEDEIPDNQIDDDENGFIDDVMGWDWWYDDNDPLDDMGHGTFIAGIVGAISNNEIGIAGICWDCKIMNLKIVNDTGWTKSIDLAISIEYAAENGADVISMSWGIYQNKSYIYNAVNYAYEKGVVLVAAAGNDNISKKLYPASYNNIIAVAGTDHDDKRMHFYDEDDQKWYGSNYGPWVDIAAPAVDIYSTRPTYHVWYNELGAEQNYSLGDGTSYATPIVAGVAALMLSKNPSLTPDEIKSNIKKYSDPYDSDYDLGAGRVNAYQAVKKVKIKSFYDFLDNNPSLFPILRQLLLKL